MKYRRLGKTGLHVSVVGVGTWQFGGEWGRAFTQSEAGAILDRAAELGINLVDTAECYGDHLSEQLVGRAIKRHREKWIVATKFGHRFTGHFQRDQLWSPEDVDKQLHASLKALGTDYIDLYQFHSGSNDAFDQDALWEMLQRHVDSGKIHHLGISLSPNTNMHQVSRASLAGVSTVQVVYNRLDRAPEAEVLPSCREQDLGVLARVPLASGLLSGKYKPGATFDNPEDIRAQRDAADIERQLEEVQRIQQEEVPSGTPMAAWALAWCLRNQAVSCVIPGCKSPEQVTANAVAADLLAYPL
jgi:aryl-alcohol dehydrogenase-like predicted oxidoreductase